jgi:hypothetical protein
MPAITAARIKRTVRKAELASGSGATGYTILKFRSSPIARLVENHDIGPEEYWAANDISFAFHAITGAIDYKPLMSEKIDRGVSEYIPARIIDSVARYRAWATHWTSIRAWGDLTFDVVIAAVVSQLPFYVIALNWHLDRAKAKQVTIAGLRDYAARSTIVPPQQAQQWITAAAKSFHVKHPDLRLALLQAQRTY